MASPVEDKDFEALGVNESTVRRWEHGGSVYGKPVPRYASSWITLVNVLLRRGLSKKSVLSENELRSGLSVVGVNVLTN